MFDYMSPALKVFMSLAFAIIVAVAQWEITLIVCAIMVILSVFMARISIGKIIKLFKPLWLFLIVLSIVTAITSDVIVALTLTVRIALITITASVLLETTKESELERGIGALISPLALFHVPIRDIAFVITLTLRFIPRITEEWGKLKMAQEARGVIISELPIKNRFKITFQCVGTLLINSTKRAEETAMALDARGYGLGDFTPRKKEKLKRLDYIVLILFAIFCIFLGLLEFLH